MIGDLPKSLAIGEAEYEIRSDYRDILYAFEVFNDPELEPVEKWIVVIYLLLEPFSCADDVLEAAEKGFSVEEAANKIDWFISAGKKPVGKIGLPVYDWVQDEQMIFAAVNKVAGKETRELDYLHWWTFLGYFNEVGEGTFSLIIGIRDKLNKGKKLEKHEKEFLKNNKELVILDIKRPMTEEEKKEDERIKALADEVLG